MPSRHPHPPPNIQTIIWLLIVFILSVNYVYTQNNTYSITGNIVDNNSNSPLFYVNVGLLNETDSVTFFTTTDKNGVFKFLNVKEGNYIIKTSYIGYDIHQQQVSVMGENKEIAIETIHLQSHITTLQNVTISATNVPIVPQIPTTHLRKLQI